MQIYHFCVICACRLSVSVTSSLLSLHSVFVVVSHSPGQINITDFQHKDRVSAFSLPSAVCCVCVADVAAHLCSDTLFQKLVKLLKFICFRL